MSASPAGLCEFIDASPSPFHVCATAAERLRAEGFRELSEADGWPAHGRFFTVRAGSLVAWRSENSTDVAPAAPFRIVGGHTDSPNLRVKQHPDRFVSGWQVVALQPYGGAWLNSWLDRDLGISGRLSVRTGDTIEHRLVRIDDPILRVPQLAIHLAEDRKAVALDQRGVGYRQRNAVVPGIRRRAGRRRGERRARLRPDDP
jgi:aspartyl aminopeptidase